MINFISKKWLYYFYRLIPNGIFLSNKHLLVLNGHKRQLKKKKIETIKQNQRKER